MIMQVIA